jgi:hypothetical protein
MAEDRARCDSCGCAASGTRDDPPDGWAAYRLQATGDDDMGEINLVACSWECAIERCQVIIELTRSVFEVSGGLGDLSG